MKVFNQLCNYKRGWLTSVYSARTIFTSYSYVLHSDYLSLFRFQPLRSSSPSTMHISCFMEYASRMRFVVTASVAFAGEHILTSSKYADLNLKNDSRHPEHYAWPPNPRHLNFIDFSRFLQQFETSSSNPSGGFRWPRKILQIFLAFDFKQRRIT